MRRMKNVLSLLLAVTTLLMLSACGGGNNGAGNQLGGQTDPTPSVKDEITFPELKPLKAWDYNSVLEFREDNAPNKLQAYYKMKETLNLSNESYEDGTFHYAINREEKTARVNSYIGDPNATELSVPGEVEGCQVITFACGIPDSVTTLILPEGLLGIHGSCSMADGLTSVTFPSTLLTIQDDAFYACRSLTEVTLPGSLCLVEGFDLTAISEITIPKNVFYVRGFNVCHNLKTVKFAESNHVVAVESAFMNCKLLTECTFPISGNCIVKSNVFKLSPITLPEELIYPKQ